MTNRRGECGALFKTVALVGAGVIGSSWAKVFTRVGCSVRVFDRDKAQCDRLLAWLRDELNHDCAEGRIQKEDVESRIALVTLHTSLEEAVKGVGYIQESVPERIEIKQQFYTELDLAADANAIIASSTSGLDMTVIAGDIPGRWRCVVAHPINPPYVTPAVEIVPGKDTTPAVVDRVRDFMASVGQIPVVMKQYCTSFIANRLQSALIKEAIALVAAGVADADAVDAVVRDGLGLRWALMGPFAVASTNAQGGVRDYFTRHGDSYRSHWKGLSATPELTPELVELVGRSTDAMLHGATYDELCRWRDRMILTIRALKEGDPPPWVVRTRKDNDGEPKGS